MDYMDSNKIGQRIENKLIHALGRTISEATMMRSIRQQRSVSGMIP